MNNELPPLPSLVTSWKRYIKKHKTNGTDTDTKKYTQNFSWTDQTDSPPHTIKRLPSFSTVGLWPIKSLTWVTAVEETV